MSAETRAEVKKHAGISVGDWIGTILLSLVPVVNVITFIVLIVMNRSSAKRNFAVAALIVSFILVLMYLAAIMFFYDPIMRFFEDAKTAVALP